MQKLGNTSKPVAAPPKGLIIASDRIPVNVSGKPLSDPLIWQLLNEVQDPEVPVVSVVELGIVRNFNWQDGQLLVDVTPTYSGCPATDLIEELIAEALIQGGIPNPQIRRVLTPAWTTDWITESGREKLRQFGIAPPQGSASKTSLLGHVQNSTCPQCGTGHIELVREFGSTPCKALYTCKECLEPFDYFKCI